MSLQVTAGSPLARVNFRVPFRAVLGFKLRTRKHSQLSLIEPFKAPPDPRVPRPKDHDLIDLLVLPLCTLFCAGESFNDMADFGAAKQVWFKSFLEAALAEATQPRPAERRYSLTSLPLGVEPFARAVRGHWSVENKLHWVLDVCFREDQSRARAG